MFSRLISLVIETDRARLKGRKTPQVDLAWGEAARFCDITGAGHVDCHLTAASSFGVAGGKAGREALGLPRQSVEVLRVADHDVRARFARDVEPESLGAASLIDRISLSRAVRPTRTIIPSGLSATRATERPCQIPVSGSDGGGGPFERAMQTS